MSNSIIFEDQEITPSKIVCVGLNYVDHIDELNNQIPKAPVIFIKPNSAISNTIELHGRDEIHYEGEISFLIMKGKLIGVGFGLDLTKRVLQSTLRKEGLPWERSKAFDKSAVFSKFVRLEADISMLRMELYINNKLIQNADYEHMLNKPLALAAEISTFMTMEDGDILMTGTPSGVGIINSGDHFVGKIYCGNELIIDASWLV